MSRTTPRPRQRLEVRSRTQDMIQVGAHAGVQRMVAEKRDPMLKLQRRIREAVDWDLSDEAKEKLEASMLSEDEETT